MKILFCIIILFFSFHSPAQNEIDSLKNLLREDLSDSARVRVLNALASKHFYKDPIRTDSFATLAIQIARSLNDPEGLANALRYKGISYAIRGDFDQAREYYHEALDQLKQANIRQGKPDLHYAIGVTYAETGEYELANHSFSKALREQKLGHDSTGIANTFVGIANFHKKISQYAKGAAYLDSAAAIYENLDMPSELSVVKNNQANIYMSLDNYPKALEYAREALAYNEQAGLDQKIAINYHTIGSIYGYLDYSEKAEEYYKKSYELKKKLGMVSGMAVSMSNLGSLLRSQEKYKEAKETFLQVRSLYASADMICNMPYVDLNLGTIFLHTGNKDSAYYYLNKSLKESDACQIDEVAAKSLILLGELYITDGRNAEAEKSFLKALEIATTAEIMSIQVDAATHLYEFYKERNQPLNAFKYLEISAALKDRLFNEENTRKIARLESKYEFETEKALLNEQFERENLKQKSEVEKQILMRDTAIIIASLLLVLVIGTIIVYSKLKQKNKLLALQKRKLEESIQTNEKLLSLLSHDLRSPLHGMQSLITLWKGEFLTKEELEQISIDVEVRIQNLLQFLDNILNWSKNNFSKLQAKKEPVDLNESLQETILLLKPNADLKRIAIRFAPEQDHKLLADDVMLKVIFRNILSNAIKFSNESGVIDVKVSEEKRMTNIAFTDYGVGISEEVKHDLLKKAVHSKEGTTNEMGAGIGLFLSQDFVQLHKGSIEIFSEEGKGSTFLVSIPNKRTE